MSDQFVHSLFPPTCKFEFLPKESIDKLVLKETVIQELSDPESRFKPAQEEEFIQWILHKAPRLFLTVLDSRIVKEPYDKYYSLCSFRARGFDDDQMPWTDSSILRPIHASSDRGWFDHVWSKEMNTNFRRSQWRFVVPTITSKQFIYKLHAHQVLPFLKVVSDPKEGAFGRVYCVQVEKSHIDIGFLVERIAVKEIMNSIKQHEAVAEAWPNEVRVLGKTKSLNDPHLITCIAAIERGNERYLLFPWAQDGNLREYWETPSERFHAKDAITEALVQLKGLATALRHLHYFGLREDGLPEDSDDLPTSLKDEYDQARTDISIRHGDLKPENLLWFLEETPDSKKTRYLKIADMGIAKRHVVATQDRGCLTSTRYGTILYEAPEAQTSSSGRSRQYDVWSMGCITFEWVIWILYGNEQLKRFYSHLKSNGNEFTPYYQLDARYIPKTAKVHHAVVHWMSHMMTKHSELQEESAIRDLLELVKDRLLVVPLPARRPTTLLGTGQQYNQSSHLDLQEGPTQPRATSKEFEIRMDQILEKVGEYPNYLLRSSNLRSCDPPPDFKPQLDPEMSYRAGKASTPGKGVSIPSSGLRVSRLPFTTLGICYLEL
ncbi:hypothetical protein FPOAC2_04338 [Fusarium poae]